VNRSAGLRTTVQTLIVGPILLALSIRGLIVGPHPWPRTVLWIWGVVTGGGLLLVGMALLYARRGRSDDRAH
jgi:hypothetical protein